MSNSYTKSHQEKGQSFVELAMVLPLLLFLLLAFVEVGGVIYHYLNMLDVVREAARYASEHDYEDAELDNSDLPQSACDDGKSHYYYDTACSIVFDDLNPDISLNPATDDVTISVFTIENNLVTDRWPNDGDGVWSLYSENWTRNCDGSLRSTAPFRSNADIENSYTYTPPTLVPTETPVNTPAVPPTAGPTAFASMGKEDKGVVLVEIYYCHEQLLGLPVISDILPNPVQLHAFSVMPAPAAAP